MQNFRRQMQDYRLTTLDITYHLPDHPGLLQTFLWQCLDQPPRFPAVEKFLEHWRRTVEARLHSIRIAYAAPLADGRWRHIEELRGLH